MLRDHTFSRGRFFRCSIFQSDGPEVEQRKSRGRYIEREAATVVKRIKQRERLEEEIGSWLKGSSLNTGEDCIIKVVFS